jgi:hypothetical protein
MFGNVIAEKSNNIFTRTNKLFPVRNNPTNKIQGRIVVKSPDTDVLVLLVHYFRNMKNTSEPWFQTGLITSTKDCRRYNRPGKVIALLGENCSDEYVWQCNRREI